MEWAVRILYLLSLALITLSYIGAWFQHQISNHFNWSSPFVFHLGTAGTSVMICFFANLSVLFYFIGTGVWMKDQAKALLTKDKARAQKIWAVYERSNKLKAKAFPFATFSIFLGILTFVMGGAYQVGAIPPWLHPTLATLLCLCGWLGIRFVFSAMKTNLQNLNECSSIIDEIQS
jgi:hypothetical protein